MHARSVLDLMVVAEKALTFPRSEEIERCGVLWVETSMANRLLPMSRIWKNQVCIGRYTALGLVHCRKRSRQPTTVDASRTLQLQVGTSPDPCIAFFYAKSLVPCSPH